MRHLAPLASMRLPGSFGLIPLEAGAPGSTQAPIDKHRTNSIIFTPQFCDAAFDELTDFKLSESEVAKVIQGGFGSIPLVVLISEQGETNSADLVHLSNHSILLNTHSDHYVPYNDPETIIRSIITCINMINNTSNCDL